MTDNALCDSADPPRRKGRLRRTLGLVIIIGVSALSIIFSTTIYIRLWQFERPPVKMTKLKSLRPEATEQEVIAAIGKPRNIYDRKWSYSRTFGWSIVYIHFDESNRFREFVYDR